MHRTQLIDFSKIDLQDALDLAALIEDEAKERYTELAEQMDVHHNAEAADFFRFMHSMEAHHEEHLKRVRERRFGAQPSRVHRSMIFDIEAPEYGDVYPTMSARDALEIARRSEERAFAFYEEALSTVLDADVHDLFYELSEEEYQHQQLLDSELERLPRAAPSALDGLEDEPVAL